MAGKNTELFEFEGDASGLISAIENAGRELRKFAGGDYKAKARIDINKASRAQLLKLETDLRELDATTTNVEVKMVVKEALGALDTLDQRYERVRKKVTSGGMTTPKNAQDILPDMRTAEAATARLGKNLSLLDQLKGGGSLKKVATAADELADKATGAASVVRRLPALISGVVLSLGAAMIPAILATGVAITGLVIAIGALATALVAAAGPAVMLLVGVFARITKVLEARKQAEAAKNSEVTKGAQEEQKAAANAETNRAAQEGIKRAIEGVAKARRGYNEAVKSAGEDIANATRREADAARDLQQANKDLGEATVNAYEEMEDAVRDLRDAVLGLESAKLDSEEADLNTRQAVADLKKLREEAGATANTLDGAFERFTNVDIDFDTSVFRDAMRGATGGGDGDKSLELEQAILRVRRARLGEKQSALDVKKAEDTLGDSRRVQADFLKNGINASKSYQSAQEGVRSATVALADATREAALLTSQGIARNPQVIAAAEAVRDAERGVGDARRTAARALEDQALGAKEASAAQAVLDKKTGELTATEVGLLAAIDKIIPALKKAFGPATDAVFKGIVESASKLTPFLGALEGPMKRLGDTWAGVLKGFTRDLAIDAMLGRFKPAMEGSIKVSQSFGDIFRALFDIFLKVANAAMPLLIGTLDKLANAMQSIGGGINEDGLTKVFEPAVKMLETIVGGAFELGRAIVGIFSGAAGPVQDFINWIKDGIKGFADFTNSAKGKDQIKKFFEDTLPFVKSLVKFVITFGKIFFKALQIALPILKPTLDFIVFIAQAFLLLLRAVDFIIGPFKGLLGILLSFFTAGGIVKGVFTGIGLALSKFGPLISKVFAGTFKSLTGPFLKFSSWILGWIGRIIPVLQRITGAVIRPFRAIGAVILNVIRFAFKGVTGYFKFIGRAWSFVWENIIRVFSAVFKKLQAPVKWVIDKFRSLKGHVVSIFGGIGRAISSAFNGAVQVMQWALDRMKQIANFFIRGWNKIFGKERSVGVGKLKLTLPSLHINELASGGILNNTIFAAGESGKEAVIPLTNQVLGKLARQIMGTLNASVPAPAFAGMRMPSAPAAATGGGGGINIERIELPPPPQGGVPDARYQAVQLAHELRRRGGR